MTSIKEMQALIENGATVIDTSTGSPVVVVWDLNKVSQRMADKDVGPEPAESRTETMAGIPPL